MIDDTEALLRDEEARRRILTDLDTTFLVEAGAGSGKTTSIVGRMLAVIMEGKAEARQMAAITFTNKAAGELLGRFRIKLESAAADAATAEERAVWERALHQLPECFVGTIHAFCGRLLRERPLEAGLDPAFREIDELEDRELRERNWDRYLAELERSGDTERLGELIAMQVDVDDLRAVYHRVSQYEDVEIRMTETERPDFAWIRDTLVPMITEAGAYLPTFEPEKGWDPLQTAIRQARRHLEVRDMEDEMNILRLARLFDRSLTVTQNRWTDKAKAKAWCEAFQSWRGSALEPFLKSWREYIHPKAVAFVLPAVRLGRESRIAEGKLNFQDLLLRAAELLRSDAGVRDYFARRFRVLFVDEFQDTDPAQAEMMLLLTGRDARESDWRRSVPRPGSLFVVGDPKQSIYRFRRADISTYNFVKTRIAASGDVIGLTRNFRSVHAIGDYVNVAFAAKFTEPGGQSDYQAAFVRMLTQLPNPPEDRALHGVFTMTVPKQDYDRQLDIACCDAERTAAFIAWACQGNLNVMDKDGRGKPVLRPAEPGDFLVLVKYRKYIALYAELLEQYGLPSDTSGSEAMTEELRAVRLLAQSLNNRADPIALLAVLRGMLFGISDDELYHYRREGGAVSLDSIARSDELSDKGRRVEEAIQTLRRYAEWTAELPALAAFARIVDDMGLLAASAGAGSGGAIRCGTLVKLLELLQQDADAAVDWTAMTKRLNRLTDEESMESASLFSGSGAAVRVMNLHKAKGLEAPVVLLACPCGCVEHDASEHVDRMAEPPQGYFTIEKRKDSYTTEVIAQPAGWEERAEEERLFMRAETDRLLYVAATRAKQLLIVSRYPSRPAIDPWSPLAGSLERYSELYVPNARPLEAEELRQMPPVAQWEETRTLIMERAIRPSYRLASVTGLAKASGGEEEARRLFDEGGVPSALEEAGGTAYGTLVHRCLQALGEGMDDGDLPLFTRLAAQEAGLDERWAEKAEEAVRLTVASELWRRVMRAKRRCFEYTFLAARSVPAPESGAAETLLLHGVIDLAFEEDDGWVIADFKTDRYGTAPEESGLAARYKPQLAAYAEEWERMNGGAVKETGLYFVHSHKYRML
ncbi:UvrD-helicase domain-containing protein [Paenibacillus soyae]|uniref:DNA 3'-5' helicase n=1 Tax=Paenibacillus soyae TaxID=2969249 RepID=A0A9X2MW93_9BACL|nr:UvrD-helicase domain-containing protein [Paenibacillus soyae]MCR2804852.1 UvrD-helicase domain-containing protein [Paenibacillus soyae]